MKKLSLIFMSLILASISFGNTELGPCVSCTNLPQDGRCFISDPINGPGWCGSNDSIWEIYEFGDPYILAKPQCNWFASAIYEGCPE